MQGQRIIEQARTWIGTKFRYQGRVKKNFFNCGGIDCLGLVVCVLDELGFSYGGKRLRFYDTTLHHKREYLPIFFHKKLLQEISVGDIISQNISTRQTHLAFYAGSTIIHASASARSVVETNFTSLGSCQIYSVFVNALPIHQE